MKRRSPGLARALWAAALIGAAAQPQQASAEFVRTGHSVYQGVDLRAKVLISRADPGIFIASGPEISFQHFELQRLTNSSTAHCFIRYDAQANRYSEILAGGREYRIRGTLSLDIGNMRVTVDNDNPYLSIVLNPPAVSGMRPGILGFTGIEPIVNAVGDGPIAVLEANRLSDRLALVKSYGVTRQGLVLDEEPVAAETVGLEIEGTENPCAEPSAVIISRAGLDRAAASADRDAAFNKLVAAARNRHPLERWLELRVTAEQIVSFDYDISSVVVVRQIKTERFPGVLCVFEPLAD